MSFAVALAFVGQACFLTSNYTAGIFGVVPAYDLKPCLLSEIREDYTYVPGIGAYKLHTDASDWNSARATCESEGGHLAIINSVAESEVISQLFATGSNVPVGAADDRNYAYIGFHHLFRKDEYRTLKGDTLEKAGFADFAEGEPNFWGDREWCGSVYKDGKLNDIDCNGSYRFFCELSYPYVSYQ